jgi:predicted Zn-dependent peptidase
VVVLPADLPVAFDALRRVLRVEPTPTDLERERPVILREIAHESEERRLIWQLLAEALYGDDHPLARPILGTPASVEAMTIEHLEPARARLSAPTVALAAVGPVDSQAIVTLAETLPLDGGLMADDQTEPGLPDVGRRHVERRSDLLHVAVGWRFDGLADPRLPVLRLAEIVLAHGSGSRLYRRLRTERRLAYRVSTILIPYREAGHVSAVTSCDPHHAAQAETAIVAEVERLAARGPSLSELDAARRQHEGMTARRYESSRQLAAWAATQLLWSRPAAVDESYSLLAEISPTDIRDACGELVRDGHAVASVGRLRPRH